MPTPTVISVDAQGNVTFSTQSVVTLTQLQSNVSADEQQVQNAQAIITATQTQLTEAQAQLTADQSILSQAQVIAAKNAPV